MSLSYEDLQIPDGRSEKIRSALDAFYSNSPVGTISTSMSDTFRGLNHRQQPNSIPINRDLYGLTFFTRPRMNMTSPNLRQSRLFSPMLTTNDLTIPRAIRALLDTESHIARGPRGEYHSSRLVDRYQAFIPILTNQLISISGWPDVIAPTYTAQPGAYQETFSMVDGLTINYGAFDIRANFRNIQGDPITALFLTWAHYASLVFQGILMPYPDALIENEIDYMTRIYRLVLDPSRRFVQKIAACGAGFPVDAPIGNAFNYEQDKPINQGNDQISVTFKCFGAMYQDPILIDQFNRSVSMHNSDMGGDDSDRSVNLVKLDAAYVQLFNHMGYPRINPDTMELEWWVFRKDYDEYVFEYQENNAGE
jgi:hypothetical protein